MERFHIFLLGLSTICWSSLYLYVAGEKPLLAMLAVTGAYGVYTIKLMIDCECGKKHEQR